MGSIYIVLFVFIINGGGPIVLSNIVCIFKREILIYALQTKMLIMSLIGFFKCLMLFRMRFITKSLFSTFSPMNDIFSIGFFFFFVHRTNTAIKHNTHSHKHRLVLLTVLTMNQNARGMNQKKKTESKGFIRIHSNPLDFH